MPSAAFVASEALLAPTTAAIWPADRSGGSQIISKPWQARQA
jgi:hypothetical protein